MLPQVMLRRRRGGSCFRVEHLLLCGIPNLETIKEVNSASKPTNQWNKIFIYKMFRSLFTLTTSGIFPFFLARQRQGILLHRFPPLKPCANENFPYPLVLLRLGATLTRP
jgi:hypothetical protein